MPWNNVTTITPGSVLREVSACRSWTLRQVWLRATATSGWRKDTEDQVKPKERKLTPVIIISVNVVEFVRICLNRYWKCIVRAERVTALIKE